MASESVVYVRHHSKLSKILTNSGKTEVNLKKCFKWISFDLLFLSVDQTYRECAKQIFQFVYLKIGDVLKYNHKRFYIFAMSSTYSNKYFVRYF